MYDTDDPNLYNQDWQNPDEMPDQDPPGTITVIARDAGTVTVRTNYDLVFTAGLPFFSPVRGEISRRIPKGAKLKGRDTNNNNIPDILEYITRHVARFVRNRTGTRPDDK